VCYEGRKLSRNNKTYHASVFASNDTSNWRGVSTGYGWFYSTNQFVRSAVNLVADDRSMRRRGGQRALQRRNDSLLHSSRVGNIRASSFGGSVYVNSFDERERAGGSEITF